MCTIACYYVVEILKCLEAISMFCIVLEMNNWGRYMSLIIRSWSCAVFGSNKCVLYCISNAYHLVILCFDKSLNLCTEFTFCTKYIKYVSWKIIAICRESFWNINNSQGLNKIYCNYLSFGTHFDTPSLSLQVTHCTPVSQRRYRSLIREE